MLKFFMYYFVSLFIIKGLGIGEDDEEAEK